MILSYIEPKNTLPSGEPGIEWTMNQTEPRIIKKWTRPNKTEPDWTRLNQAEPQYPECISLYQKAPDWTWMNHTTSEFQYDISVFILHYQLKSCYNCPAIIQLSYNSPTMNIQSSFDCPYIHLTSSIWGFSKLFIVLCFPFSITGGVRRTLTTFIQLYYSHNAIVIQSDYLLFTFITIWI